MRVARRKIGFLGIGLALLGLAFFSSSERAFASTIIISENADVAVPFVESGNVGRTIYQSFKASFSYSGSSTLSMWTQYGGAGDPGLSIYMSNAFDDEATANASMGNGTTSCFAQGYPNNLGVINNSVFFSQVTSTIPIPLVSGKYYVLCFYDGQNGGGTSFGNIFGSATDDYEFGIASSTGATIEDLALEITDGLPWPVFVDLTYPGSGSNANQFSSWIGSYKNPSTSTNPLVRVKYGATTTYWSFQDSGSVPDLHLIEENPESGGFVLQRTTELATGTTYYAFAELYDQIGSSTIILASSSIVSFSFTTPSQGHIDIGGISLQPDCASLDLTAKVFCYLFIPDSQTITQFRGLSSQISNKAPWGYLSLIRTAITGISTSTPNTPQLDVENFSVFLAIRNIMQYILWLALLVWGVHRVRQLEL